MMYCRALGVLFLVVFVSAQDCEEGFSCDNGQCIPQSEVCDNVNNCGDNTDENNCAICGNGSHIPTYWVCDGLNDCGDNSEEMNCTLPSCATDEFDCGNFCIPNSWVCDEEDDCGDNIDEVNCTNLPDSGSGSMCPSNQFPCANGNCVFRVYVCDKFDDCTDNSDEADCPYQDTLTAVLSGSPTVATIPGVKSTSMSTVIQTVAPINIPVVSGSPKVQNQTEKKEGLGTEEIAVIAASTVGVVVIASLLVVVIIIVLVKVARKRTKTPEQFEFRHFDVQENKAAGQENSHVNV